MKYRGITITICLFVLAFLAVLGVESRRPVQVTQVREECSPRERARLDSLAVGWKYLEPGPANEGCFHYHGPTKRNERLVIRARVCVRWKDNTQPADVGVRGYFETTEQAWSLDGDDYPDVDVDISSGEAFLKYIRGQQ